MEFLCIEFLNRSRYVTKKLLLDPFKNTEWLITLADKWIHTALPSPSEAELTKLAEMRSCLFRLLVKTAQGQSLSETDIKLLNSYMAAVSFCHRLQAEEEGYSLKAVPESMGWSWFMAEAAASFSRLYSSEAVKNLKMCQNPECEWFFIDESKSRNRKWCDDSCANLMKVRRFRQKQK